MSPIDNNNDLKESDLLDSDKNTENLIQFDVEVTVESDFVAKIDVTGLSSNTKYVYAFVEATTGVTSDIGLTQTAPSVEDVDVTKLTYAVFSCAQFRNGFFHPYDIGSTIQNLDLWIHVGDYYYE